MEKRYQVFVSSTYEDLQLERQEVMQALLELDCIPAGMELFPAANEDQWTLIKKVIDECDYYLVISAGRYGSINADGISYTEMEYRYAVENKKPTIAFIHKDPESIPAKYSEQLEENRKKLVDFKTLLQTKMCKYFSNPADLGSVVSRSLIHLIKANPAIGWVRANEIESIIETTTASEILKFRKRIEDLEKELSQTISKPPGGIENLSQGDDLFSISYSFNVAYRNEYRRLVEVPYNATMEASWNQIYGAISPSLINEATDSDIYRAINSFIEDSNKNSLARNKEFKKKYDDFLVRGFSISSKDYDTIIVQFRALGLIKKSELQRSIKDRQAYWTLTPYGDSQMTKLRAISKATD
jgi:hypothetical protein